MGSLLFIGFFPYFIFRNLDANLIKFKLNTVIRNDCNIFDEDIDTKQNYFTKKFHTRINRPKNSETENVIINSDSTSLNSNHAMNEFESKEFFKRKFKFFYIRSSD